MNADLEKLPSEHLVRIQSNMYLNSDGPVLRVMPLWRGSGHEFRSSRFGSVKWNRRRGPPQRPRRTADAETLFNGAAPGRRGLKLLAKSGKIVTPSSVLREPPLLQAVGISRQRASARRIQQPSATRHQGLRGPPPATT